MELTMGGPPMKLRSTFTSVGGEMLPLHLDERSRRAIDDLLVRYNPLGGPVRKVTTYLRPTATLPIYAGDADYYDFDHVVQRITGLSSAVTGVQRNLFGGGKGLSVSDMFVGSLAEVVERALGGLAYFETSKQYVFGSWSALTRRGLPCLAPGEMPLFAPEQYADPDLQFVPFTADAPLSWKRGSRLISGDEVWVPAQLVDIFFVRQPAEAVIGYSVSGGLSSHRSRAESLYHGITELIERDAVNIRWYCGLPPERIELDRPSRIPTLRRLFEADARHPGELVLYSHAVDIPEVPVVTAIEIDPWLNRYAYHPGGGADLDADVALLKAVNEFGQSEGALRIGLISPRWKAVGEFERYFDMDPDAPLADMDLFIKAVSYYGHRKNREKMRWYLTEGRSVPLSSLPVAGVEEPEARYEQLLLVLRRHGLDPIVFDFTPSGMRQSRLTKVFLPELVQAFLQSQPMLGHPRLAQGARLLGRDVPPLSFGELTRDPLPYP
jgi:ribosomal protein S12 methylthiotransferase accessory factor